MPSPQTNATCTAHSSGKSSPGGVICATHLVGRELEPRPEDDFEPLLVEYLGGLDADEDVVEGGGGLGRGGGDEGVQEALPSLLFVVASVGREEVLSPRPRLALALALLQGVLAPWQLVVPAERAGGSLGPTLDRREARTGRSGIGRVLRQVVEDQREGRHYAAHEGRLLGHAADLHPHRSFLRLHHIGFSVKETRTLRKRKKERKKKEHDAGHEALRTSQVTDHHREREGRTHPLPSASREKLSFIYGRISSAPSAAVAR